MRFAVILALLLAPSSEVAQAGFAYRQALESLEAAKYEEAVRLLREAIRFVGQETDELKYRDDDGRRKHAYFPYYDWARARYLQAQKETSLAAKEEHLQDALGRLGQTRHSEGAKLQGEVSTLLAAVVKLREAESAFGGLQSKINILCDNDKYEEALRELETLATSFPARADEIGKLRTATREKQKTVVDRHEKLLAQRMAEILASDPTTAADEVGPLLKPTFIPAGVVAQPAPAFGWVQSFLALHAQQTINLKKASLLSADESVKAAEAFETASEQALAAGFPAGFRAARHMAHALRMAKLKDVLLGASDVFDTPSAKTVASAADQAAVRAEAAVRARKLAADDARTAEGDVAAHRRQTAEIAQKLEAAAKERARLTEPIVRAEETLGKPETVIDPAALAKVRNDLFELASDSSFATLTARLRARAFFAQAVTEATAGFLQGEPKEKVHDRTRGPALKAYLFDAKVDAPWRDRLSPKILKLFDEIKPQ